MATAIVLLLLGLIPTLPATAAPVISEFVAANSAGLKDEDGEASDWIEIHNPGAAEVSLAGWTLTDDATQPAKWKFPDLRLPAGGRVVVFASGKNRPGPSPKPLHTNFRLAEQGEYLGLFPPQGTRAASEFAPTYPVQTTDVAYGAPGAAAADLLEGAPVAVLIPTSAADLASDWTAPGYVTDGRWLTPGGLGVGFDPTPGGGGAGANLAARGTATQSTTGFGMPAEFAIDGDPETFTHTASEDDASWWSVDLGGLREISRIVLRNRTSCCQSRLRDLTVKLLGQDGTTVVWTSSLLNPENELGSPESITVDLFELNVGPVPARVVRVERTPDPDLSGTGGVGNADEDNVLSLGEVEVYGVDTVSFADFIRSDLGAAMQGKQSTALIRVPFVVPATAVQGLTLRLWFDEGVVVFLDGRQIFASNAPPVLAWDARASGDRPKAVSIQPVTLPLDTVAGGLAPGTHWLAFHLLNASPEDPDLLLHARLEATVEPEVTAAYLEQPTPGQPNEGPWYIASVADTRFSVGRGLYRDAFELAITSETPGAEIRYTLDGSVPGPDSGLRYERPLRIERTTVVRAAAFKTRYRATNVDTHTYVFPEQVASQPARPEGFPTSWAGVPADYAMDSRITANPAWAPGFGDRLRTLPSLSLVGQVDDFFGTTRGIYANPERNGVAWERPVSMEWMDLERGEEFQVGAGLRIQGGYFRQRGVTQKHSLRLLFKEEYGPGKLRQDLFHEFGAAREFDTLVLRAGANDGYSWDAAKDTEQFIRDEFGRRLMLGMGQPSVRGRFVHLYLNGLYWGVYNLTERPAEDFSATYLGGEPEEWDAVNSGDVKSGSLAAWNTFISGVRSATTLAAYQRLKGLNPDGTPNPAFPTYLDAPNYIDYMMVNLWGGNWDWPNKNFWFGRHNTNTSTGFKFYLWDFENTMGNNRDRSPLDMVAPRPDIESSWVGEPHFRLRQLDEYRMEFADRVQRHFFRGGVLDPATLVPRYRALAETIEPAIVAESARWGDDHHSPPQDLTDWQRERDWILGTYLVQRSGIVLEQFRTLGLYPRTPAPEVLPAGGSVTGQTPIQLTTTASELLYSTNGLDPRLPGGAIRPGVVRLVFSTDPGGPADPELVRSGAIWRYLDNGTDPGATWTQPDFADAGWPAGPSELGYGDGDEATVVGFVDADPAQDGMQRNATSFFRHAFDLATVPDWSRLRVSVTYDDAVAVFLNGTEILRTANLPANARHTTLATASSADNAVITLTNVPASLLRAGRNVVAAEVHQSSAGSTDISFDLTLTGLSDRPPVVHVTEPFLLAGPTLLKARARQGGEWSALTEATFTFGTVAPSSNLIVVSQFCYRPPNPVTPAERAVSEDRDDYEYLEFLNIGAQTVDLGGARMAAGVLHVFAAGTLLEPGQRAVLVRNRAAFQARYGATVPVLGEYDGSLDNAGEELALVDASGRDLRRFTYGDAAPWPALPDTDGFALVLQRPRSNPDHGDPLQWRSSVLPGGSPGASDASSFTGQPLADVDGNGQADLLDYALGVAPGGVPEGMTVELEPATGPETPRRLRVTFLRRIAADDAPVVPQAAEDVSGTWSEGAAWFELVDEQRVDALRTRVTYRCTPPVAVGDALFVRLQVLHRP